MYREKGILFLNLRSLYPYRWRWPSWLTQAHEFGGILNGSLNVETSVMLQQNYICIDDILFND